MRFMLWTVAATVDASDSVVVDGVVVEGIGTISSRGEESQSRHSHYSDQVVDSHHPLATSSSRRRAHAKSTPSAGIVMFASSPPRTAKHDTLNDLIIIITANGNSSLRTNPLSGLPQSIIAPVLPGVYRF